MCRYSLSKVASASAWWMHRWVALAEEVGVCCLATRDLHHFSAVRLRGGRGFELVVRPRRPDCRGK